MVEILGVSLEKTYMRWYAIISGVFSVACHK
ncbi:hypothetical protein ANAPRD1_00690 [Anaplasma phagocytophilum]|nr:hypothetical protein ANAPRD1_00690 [Anaplasma phagocytophilum]